jgi:hypothetical protein
LLEKRHGGAAGTLMFHRIIPCGSRLNLQGLRGSQSFQLPSSRQSASEPDASLFGCHHQEAKSLVSGSPHPLQLGNIKGNAASEVNMQRWL